MLPIPNFEPGKRLFDGVELQRLVSLTLAAQAPLTALAGGGQAGAPVLNYGINSVGTSGAGGTDSIQLPPAIAGTWVLCVNNTANTVAIFASVATINGVALTDTITANTTITPTASGSSINLATVKTAIFYCFATGQWKEVLSA